LTTDRRRRRSRRRLVDRHPTARARSTWRLSSYCRIEATSANPIRTEGDPPASTPGGRFALPRARGHLRAVGIGDDHRSGPLSRVPPHTPHQKPRCKITRATTTRAVCRAPLGAAARSRRTRRALQRPKIRSPGREVQTGGSRAGAAPAAASLGRANEWARGRGLAGGLVIAAHDRDIRIRHGFCPGARYPGAWI
jgi:hypothetical protein